MEEKVERDVRAVDTNILVRWLIRDDLRQVKQVETLLVGAENAGERLIVTATVLLELIWVLEDCFECAREDILQALDSLRQVAAFRFMPDGLLEDMAHAPPDKKMELDDWMIGLHAQAAGCETTLTFDKTAARSELFETLK